MVVQVLIFFVSFLVVFICTPSLIKVSLMKNLTDDPSDVRKLHSKHIPTLGGVIIFAAVLFSFTLMLPSIRTEYPVSGNFMNSDSAYLIAAILVLFFIGIKDDIVGTAAIYKLLANILVGMILVLMAKIRITGFHGLFGLHEIPEWASITLSLFTYVVVINAFNFIDGLDGLASGVGFIVSTIFGFWFVLAGSPVLAALSFALAGALIGFLIYNFSPAKIFMGDSGSLLIGLILCTLGIKLIEFDPATIPTYMINVSRPLIVMSLFAYPLIDMLRIVIIRIISGVSPFEADRNHLHHVLIDINMGHRKSSISLCLYTMSVFILVILVRGLNSTIAFLIVGSYALLTLQIPLLIRLSMRKNKEGILKEMDRSSQAM